jgi:hypothetical protein
MNKFLLLLLGIYCTAQEVKKPTLKPNFTQFELSVPLKGNPDRGETDIYGNTINDSWFLPDGFNAKFGYGIQKNRWIALSLHTGLEWKGTAKLVAIPVFGNLRLSAKIGQESRITLQSGLGRGFALGRGSLNGMYRRINLGLENDDFILFVEISEYDFPVNKFNSVNSFNLGIAIRTY